MIKIKPLITQERALKQNLSVMVYALTHYGDIKCRVFGRPDNFELFSNVLNAEIAKLERKGHTELFKLEPYEVFTTKEVEFGQLSELTPEEHEIFVAMENAKKKFAANRYASRRKEMHQLRMRLAEQQAYA